MHEVREFAGHDDIRTPEVYLIRKERRRGGCTVDPDPGHWIETRLSLSRRLDHDTCRSLLRFAVAQARSAPRCRRGTWPARLESTPPRGVIAALLHQHGQAGQ